jgi:hypothetical protein
MEALQSMAERRGPETGVERVNWLSVDDIWQAAKQGERSRGLLDAALARRINRLPANGSKQAPQAFLICYRGALLHLDGETRDFCFAGSIRDALSLSPRASTSRCFCLITGVSW